MLQSKHFEQETFVFWKNAEQSKLTALNNKSKTTLKTCLICIFFCLKHDKCMKVFCALSLTCIKGLPKEGKGKPRVFSLFGTQPDSKWHHPLTDFKLIWRQLSEGLLWPFSTWEWLASPYNMTSESNIKVTGIKEMITNNRQSSWLLTLFTLGIWLLILPSSCYTIPCKLVARIWWKIKIKTSTW